MVNLVILVCPVQCLSRCDLRRRGRRWPKRELGGGVKVRDGNLRLLHPAAGLLEKVQTDAQHVLKKQGDPEAPDGKIKSAKVGT